MTTLEEVGAAVPATPTLCLHQSCRRKHGHAGLHNPYPKEAWDFLADKDKAKIRKAGYATPRGGRKGAYQNHVIRSNRVIIPYEKFADADLQSFVDGYVIRLLPEQYFDGPLQPKPNFLTADSAVKIGVNAFVLYRSHEGYANFPPPNGWAARTLTDAEGHDILERDKGCIDHGHYVLRLPNVNGNQAREEGAPQGIFAPEYADAKTNYLCQALLAWLIVHTVGSPYTQAVAQHLRAILTHEQLGNVGYLNRRGIMNNGWAICPLCIRPIRYGEIHETISFDDVPGLENAGIQIGGATRSTVINLFHIEPLLYSSLAHLPLNIAWGHATCNTKLGQRHCYSLAELVEQDQKVAVLREDGPETFGWISGDFEMIRSDNGAVWVRLVEDAPAEQLIEELAAVLEPTGQG